MDILETISNDEKKRLIGFISDNELDYQILDNGIIKFHIISSDNIRFFFYKSDGKYIISKYNKDKDINNNPSSIAYEYFSFDSFPQVLEQIKIYDDSIDKKYWTYVDSLSIVFNKSSYIDNWWEEFKKDDEYWSVNDDNDQKIIIYENPNYNPELKSPYNTIHEISPINKISFTKVSKLYFEIHPVDLTIGRESYLVKLLCNNEKILREFINYLVISKKGLRIFIDEMFKMMEMYKVN